MKHSIVWFVVSDILGWGTYTQTREFAEEIKRNLVSSGGVDAKIILDPWD